MTVLKIVGFGFDADSRIVDIVTEYLEDERYDGLYADDCGCLLKDLAPCSQMMYDCRAGVKVPCPDTAGEFCEEGCKWHIVPREEKEGGEDA